MDITALIFGVAILFILGYVWRDVLEVKKDIKELKKRK